MLVGAIAVGAVLTGGVQAATPTTVIPDTGQGTCYDNQRAGACPQAGAAFSGQDAQYAGAQPSYTANGNGTVTDDVTGLMWAQTPDLNGDGTVTDAASGLMWQQADSGTGMNWEAALATCEALTTGGYDDWRLPNVKELQSLVDYSRAPEVTGSAALDPLFAATPITNEAGQIDYAAYWSSTTHLNTLNGTNAAYVAFGRALGYTNGWVDIHGAGAQRSDPKTGDAAANPTGRGPQRAAIRIENAVRCVRAGHVTLSPDGTQAAARLPAMQVTVTASEPPA